MFQLIFILHLAEDLEYFILHILPISKGYLNPMSIQIQVQFNKHCGINVVTI